MKKQILVLLSIVLLFSCRKDDPLVPVVLTGQPAFYGRTGIEFRANITSLGNQAVLDCGFVWSDELGYFSILDSKHISHGAPKSTGEYSEKVTTGFPPDVKDYYVKAYLKTEQTIVYGEQVRFDAPNNAYPIIDSISLPIVFPGDTILIYGKNFDPTAGALFVIVNSNYVSPFFTTRDSIRFIMPDKGLDKDINLGIFMPELNLSAKYLLSVKLAGPVIESIYPMQGTTKDFISVYGEHFLKTGSVLKLNNNQIILVNSFSDPLVLEGKKMTFYMPANADSGENIVTVSNYGLTSTAPDPISYLAPYIREVSPLTGAPGDSITISGGFYTAKPSDFRFTIDGLPGTLLSVDLSEIIFRLPLILSAGAKEMKLTVKGKVLVLPNAFTVVIPEVTCIPSHPVGTGYPIIADGNPLSANTDNFRWFTGTANLPVLFASPSEIKAFVPVRVRSGNRQFILSRDASISSGTKQCAVRRHGLVSSVTSSMGDFITEHICFSGDNCNRHKSDDKLRITEKGTFGDRLG